MGEIIRQTINLYNTVGLVDKEKNIYFVPHKADLYQKVTASRTKVCDCYYELFNQVSPFSSKYQNVDIDQWNPEDRDLIIDGLIDDFRQSRGQGLALNYLIVTRAIYGVEGEVETLKSNYYQAFFIDSVEQTGSRSVLLKLSRDYFTNFFYLNNNDTCTASYDPFNPVMKNCFVERQHYDRFDNEETPVGTYEYINLKRILGSEESFKYKYQYKKERLFLPIGVSLDLSEYKTFCNSLKAITTKTGFLTFVSSLTGNKIKWFTQLFVSYFNIIFKESILLPTSLSVPNDISYDLHYYKCGFSSYKGVTVPFTHTAIPFISIPKGFENIQLDWFSIGIFAYYSDSTKFSLVTRFVGRDAYDTDRVLDYISSIGANPYILTTFISKYSTLDNNIFRLGSYNYGVCIDYKFGLKQDNEITVNQEPVEHPTPNSMINANKVVTINKNTFALLPFSYIKTQENSNVAKLVGDISAGIWFKQYTNGVYSSSLFNVGSDGYVSIMPVGDGMWYTTETYLDEHSGSVLTAYGYTQSEIKWNCILMVVGEHIINEEQLTVKDQNEIALDKFIDPLLESDPYCFYSISINETEQILSKVKMIESYFNQAFNVKLTPILSYNDSYKIGLIPSYYISSKWERYYSEAIVTVVSSQVPIIEDSWLSYYQVNKAQMKNQYAVQSSQFSEGYTQSLTQMPFDMITGGLNKDIRGVVSGAVSGLGKLINNIVSNFYQLERIGMSQRAKLSDMGSKPDTVKLAGSDILYDMIQNERGYYLNYYRIDEVSYNSACKYLERFGYLVNIFDSLNIFDRIGLNYVKVTSFDFVEDNFVLSTEQTSAVSEIFANGVTLLHDKNFLHNLGEIVSNVNYHNYEYALRNNI